MTRRRILLIAIAANLVAAVAGGASWRLAIPSSSTRSTTTTSSSSTTLPGVDIGIALHVQAPEVSRNLERPRDLPPSSTPTSPPTTGTPTTSSQVAKPEHPQATGYGYAGASLGRYRITCYGPPQFPAGQHTADGTPVGPGIVAGDLPFGTRLQLDGLGPVTVHDRGGAVHGRHLDLWRSSCAGWSNPTVEVFRR